MKRHKFSPVIWVVSLLVFVGLLGCTAPNSANTANQGPSNEQGAAAPAETNPTPGPTDTAEPVPTAIPAAVEADAPTETPPPPTFESELDAWLRRYRAAGLFQGAVLVARDGEVIFSQGYGLADKKNDIPNTPQTRFALASVSKQFTAMAILILQEQGALDVNNNFCWYLSDCPESWEEITLHQLLTHTSGIPEYFGLADDFFDTMGTPSPPEDTLASVVNLPLEFPPGEGWAYSNTGYFLLGLVIEQAAGQSYEMYLQENIFGPLKMKDTGYGIYLPDMAVGLIGPDEARIMDVSIEFAAGGLYSTVEDLLLWDQALYTDQLLPQEALSNMFTGYAAVDSIRNPIFEGQSYGYGWFVGEDNGHRIVHHTGSIPGFKTYIMRYLDDNITAILLNNQSLLPLPEANNKLVELIFTYLMD